MGARGTVRRGAQGVLALARASAGVFKLGAGSAGRPALWVVGLLCWLHCHAFWVTWARCQRLRASGGRVAACSSTGALGTVRVKAGCCR